MTSGIYELTFAKDVTYIGKSINIDNRFKEHVSNLLRNKAAAKMQAAYKQHGLPTIKVLLACHPDHIDIMETGFISELQPQLNTVQLGDLVPLDFLLNNADLLQVGTTEHVKFIVGLSTELEISNFKVANLERARSKEDCETIAYQAAQTVIYNLKLERDYAKKELSSYLAKPWYKRLFN